MRATTLRERIIPRIISLHATYEQKKKFCSVYIYLYTYKYIHFKKQMQGLFRKISLSKYISSAKTAAFSHVRQKVGACWRINLAKSASTFSTISATTKIDLQNIKLLLSRCRAFGYTCTWGGVHTQILCVRFYGYWLTFFFFCNYFVGTHFGSRIFSIF